MAIERFEDIDGWKLARELTREVYTLTRTDPFARDYGLIDQIRRAAGSSMHNIAEGFDSGSNAEFVRFLGYALRSCTEVQSQLYVALDQQYVSHAPFAQAYGLASDARSKIGGFVKYLRKNPRSTQT